MGIFQLPKQKEAYTRGAMSTRQAKRYQNVGKKVEGVGEGIGRA